MKLKNSSKVTQYSTSIFSADNGVTSLLHLQCPEYHSVSAIYNTLLGFFPHLASFTSLTKNASLTCEIQAIILPIIYCLMQKVIKPFLKSYIKSCIMSLIFQQNMEIIQNRFSSHRSRTHLSIFTRNDATNEANR